MMANQSTSPHLLCDQSPITDQGNCNGQPLVALLGPQTMKIAPSTLVDRSDFVYD